MKLQSVTYKPTSYPKTLRLDHFSGGRVHLRVDAVDLEFTADSVDLVDLLHKVADAAIESAAQPDSRLSVRDVRDQLHLILDSLGDA